MKKFSDVPLFGEISEKVIISPQNSIHYLKHKAKVKDVTLPTIGIITFSYLKIFLSKINDQSHHQKHSWLGYPLIEFEFQGIKLICIIIRPGAPYAGAVVEELWALGL